MEGSSLALSPPFGPAPTSFKLTSPPYDDAGPPPHLLPRVPVGLPSLFERRRRKYEAELLRNQLERQSGRKFYQPTTAPSSPFSLPDTFPLPPFVCTIHSDTSSEPSSTYSYNGAFSDQRDSSVDFTHYSSSISSSSTDPIVSPFNDLLLSPYPYILSHQLKPLTGVFSDFLQIHDPPPALFQQPNAEDDVLSSLTAPFPPPPALFGDKEIQEPPFGSFFELGGMIKADDVRFGMEVEEKQAPSLATTTRPVESAAKVESPPIKKAPPSPAPLSSPAPSRCKPQSSELLGEQTAFISKLWHIITHSEYSRFLLWARDGKSFVLLKETEDEFVNVVLPRFFRHSRLTSFVRQLNLYSFQRVAVEYRLQIDASPPSSAQPSHFDPSTFRAASTTPAGPSTPGVLERTVISSGFRHSSFQRGQPGLLKQMHPRVAAKKPPTAPGSVLSRREEDSGTSRTRRNANRGIGSMQFQFSTYNPV